MYKYQHKLEEKFSELAGSAREKKGWILNQEFFRDYLLSVSVFDQNGRNRGKFNLYYSPKRDRFKLQTKGLDQPVADFLEELLTGKKTRSVKKNGFLAYVDGSFIEGRIGFGAVIIKDSRIVGRHSGRVADTEQTTSMRQVTGELQAVLEVLKWCRKKDLESITVFYDYNGIAEWARGQWKTNNPVTRKYRDIMQQVDITIKWEKVAAHSGDRYNDMADNLAKEGAFSLESTPFGE